MNGFACLKQLKHRKTAVAAGVLLAAIAVCALLLVLWLSGCFLPGWVRCRDAYVPFDTPWGWRIQDALLFDINGDGADEAVLLVWKRGSYGKHRPTWVSHDEIGFSQHVFIYEEREDTSWHPIWMSSKLGRKVASFEEGAEIAGTGRHCLVLTETDGTVTRWGWLSWGLTRVG